MPAPDDVQQESGSDQTAKETHDILYSLLDRLRIGADAASLRSLLQTLSQTTSVRTRVLSDTQDSIQGLERQLEQAKLQAQSSEQALAQRNHTDTMLSLDRTKFATAKSVSDLTDLLADAEKELRLLQQEVEEVEMDEAVFKQRSVCPEKLKAQVYSQLGLQLIRDTNGQYTQFITSSKRNNDIQTFDISSEYSQYYYANMIWELIKED